MRRHSCAWIKSSSWRLTFTPLMPDLIRTGWVLSRASRMEKDSLVVPGLSFIIDARSASRLPPVLLTSSSNSSSAGDAESLLIVSRSMTFLRRMVLRIM